MLLTFIFQKIIQRLSNLYFSLTAWPLIRDVFFYSISLILLVAFFTDELIHWYEALILLLWYAAYVGFMKFNEDVEDKLRACLNLQPAVSVLISYVYSFFWCFNFFQVKEFKYIHPGIICLMLFSATRRRKRICY